MNQTKSNSARVNFLAIDPIVESNIVSPKEEKMRGKEVMSWGEKNCYPDYLLGLYKNVTTLKSIIDGCVNYVKGDAVTFGAEGDKSMNRRGETITELVDQCAFSYLLYGGFYLQIIRTMDMQRVSEVNVLDPRYVRTNDECDVFYYSEDWKYVQNDKMTVYPKYMAGVLDPSQKASILAYKFSRGQVYPSPLYAAAVTACETERCIDEYHLNAISNGFTGSMLVNFNNGANISDQEMEEIERRFSEKFSGSKNAGRIVFCYNNGKENATTLEQTQIQDYGEKYESLAKRSRQQIFTAFKANPNLFGIPTESLGFSSEEYESAFKLFNRTQIQPIQQVIIDSFDKIYGVKGSVTITPFTLDNQKGVVR